MLEPDPFVLSALQWAQGPKVLFTNNGPMLDLCLAGPLRGLTDAFDDVVCSWHLGARKPSAEAFDRFAFRVAHDPSELLLLDDSPANVNAARSCGWRAEPVATHADLERALAADSRDLRHHRPPT